MDLSSELLEEVTGIRNLTVEDRPNEKRAATRLPMGRRGLLIRKGGKSTVMIREISASGVNLIASSVLRVGEEFVICFPRKKGSPVPVKCSTVRCEQDGMGDGVFFVGATFQAILGSANPSLQQPAENAEVQRIRDEMFRN